MCNVTMSTSSCISVIGIINLIMVVEKKKKKFTSSPDTEKKHSEVTNEPILLSVSFLFSFKSHLSSLPGWVSLC